MTLVTHTPQLLEYYGPTINISNSPGISELSLIYRLNKVGNAETITYTQFGSWLASDPDFSDFTTLNNGGQYILVSKEGAVIPYTIHNETETVPTSATINMGVQLLRYEKDTPVDISTFPNIQIVYLFTKNPSNDYAVITSFIATDPDFSDFTQFETGKTYMIISNAEIPAYQIERNNSEGINLVGTTGNDSLFGTSGNDTINGGQGVDTMVGKEGDDYYIVDEVNDVIIEAVNEGTDSVLVNRLLYTLSDNIENLYLGTGAVTGAGNSLDNKIHVVVNLAYDSLFGGAGNDELKGSLTGKNTLNGGTGIDTMVGGTNTDYFVVDNAEDSIVGGGGLDAVITEIQNYTLPEDFHHLVLGSNTIISGTGNSLDNSITGNSYSNTLDGRGGIDTLIGKFGNDYYIVDTTTDTIVEGASEGTDTVEFSNFASYTLGNNLDKLVLGAGAVDGTGNSLSNTIVGNENDNSLTGAAGNDSLDGGDGNDTLQGATSRITGEIDVLVGGAGSDQFVLGNSTTIFYDDNSSSQTGTGDYARIKNFDPLVDSLRLRSSTYYFAAPNANGEQYLYLEKGSIDEVIAILEGTNFPANTPFNASTPLPGLTTVFV